MKQILKKDRFYGKPYYYIRYEDHLMYTTHYKTKKEKDFTFNKVNNFNTQKVVYSFESNLDCKSMNHLYDFYVRFTAENTLKPIP